MFGRGPVARWWRVALRCTLHRALAHLLLALHVHGTPLLLHLHRTLLLHRLFAFALLRLHLRLPLLLHLLLADALLHGLFALALL